MSHAKTYQLSPEEQEQLKHCLLDIYRDLALVCQKHGLGLMMGGGSCLGAVRHQGFIPWDDDIDLNLFRQDYNKFRTIFNQELSEYYELVEPITTKIGQRLFAKIVKKETTLVEADTSEFMPVNGVFVDIFPIEPLPDNKLLRAVFLFGTMIFTRVLTIISEYQLNRRFIVRPHHKIIGKLTSFMPFNAWFSLYDAFINLSRGTQYCTIPSGRKGPYGEIQSLNTFLPLAKGIFEGLEVNLPNNYDRYLSSLYGDYMTMPPVNERQSLHHIVEFKINNTKFKTNATEINI